MRRVALGSFDGVHLGHREVVRRALEEKNVSGGEVVAATFDPHPRAIISPGREPYLLTAPELREEILLGLGVDEVQFITFDKELAGRSPRGFVEEVLIGALGADTVVVGENFRFGYRAAGDFEELGRMMQDNGRQALSVPVCTIGGREVNSTRIRTLLKEGAVEEASKLLGRDYTLRGEVVLGEKRGRKLGFPTVNLGYDPRALTPARGVYAGSGRVRGEEYVACTNVGVSPTFGDVEDRVEAYILDFEADVYGETIDVKFGHRLRGEEKYAGVEELKYQMGKDVAQTRHLIGDSV
jgi:riboflavin kinase/FMN adenylyltransferase